MFANRYYEQDINYVFGMNRFLFRLMGMWPFVSNKSLLSSTAVAIFIATTCFILLLIEYISSMLYVFLVLQDTRMRLNVIGSTLFMMVVIIKYSYVLLTKDQVKNCLMKVDKDWQNIEMNDRVLMIDKIRSSRRWLIMFAVFAYFTGVGVRTILPLSKGKIVTAENITIRALPCVAYFVIFDVQRSPAYEIVFVLQFFTGVIKYTITLGTLSFTTLCIMHICGELDILITLMNNFVQEQQVGNLNNRLTIVVRQQIKMQHFLQLVQNIIQYPSLIEILGSSIFVCLAGYYFLLNWETRNTAGLFSYAIVICMFSSNIFIFCYMGQQLIDQGDKVALRVCTLEWYRLPNAHARSLLLIIAMSYSPGKLQAGKFMDISIRTFGNIMKMAVTYLNFIRTS